MRALFVVLLFVVIYQSAWAGSLVIGYNEGWFRNDYGTDLTTRFDREVVAKTLSGVKQAGGKVVRIFLFELRQGFVFSGDQQGLKGIDPIMLKNLAEVLQLARALGLRVYVTGLEGNEIRVAKDRVRDFYWNLLNFKYGEGDAYQRLVLAPVLDVLDANRDAVYAFDLMNEIEAAVDASYFPNSFSLYPLGWEGARNWMQRTAAYIKAHSPWLKVTSSAGWGSAVFDLSAGFFSGLGFDFLDLHIYSDTGDFTGVTAVCERAGYDGLPLVLGEFGQKTHVQDDQLQLTVTSRFLDLARKSCFSAAFAWRFDAAEKWWAYARPDGSLRPAAQLLQNFKQTLAPRPRFDAGTR